MQNYKPWFGNRGYGNYGQNSIVQNPGVNTSVPSSTEMEWVTFKDFTGLSGVNAREDTLPQFSPNTLDVYVTETDRLTVVPGTVLFEQLTGHQPSRVALHTSLNFTSDLVLFDAPSIGVKHEGATQWHDVGLPAGRPYTWANFGGTLLFSNGNLGMYAREQGKSTVELVKGAPAARAYASFAGRVFAGHTIIDGNREPLGIRWSAASGDYHDWDLFDANEAPTGAGFELLIDDMTAGDAVIALRPMGLDFMAIMLRSSIWVAARTGDALRPVDPQPRVPGVGAINAECCKTTRFGVIFLADGPGVYLFNGNSAEFISDEITVQLKSLSRTELVSCTAEYNPLNRCYYLFTSIGTFVYDFERKRWHKRSMTAVGATIFATQVTGPTWAEAMGSWAEQEEVWQDLNPEQQDDLVFYFLGRRGSDGTLESEDASSSTAFGQDLDAFWEFPLSEGMYSTQLITTKQVIVNYDAPGTIALDFPNIDGEYAQVRTAVLAGAGQRSQPVFGENTGKGVGLRLHFTSGKASITRVQLGVILRGPRIEPLPAAFSLVSSGLIYDEDFTALPDGTLADPGWNHSQDGQLIPAAVMNGALEFKLFGGNTRFRVFRDIAGTTDLVYQINHSWPTGQQMALDALIFIVGSSEDGWPGQLYWALSRFSTFIETYFEDDDGGGFVSEDYDYGTALPQNVMYPFKFMLGNNTRVLLPLNHLVTYTAATPDLVPERIAINSRSAAGGFATTFRIGRVSAMRSNRLTCPAADGWKLRLDGSESPAASGGQIVWDDPSFLFPGTLVELLDPSGEVKGSLTPAGGVWGGTTFGFGS